jgi:6-phosphogluconolactonase/glucosamine-6-phosphate isomerase/deaminase
MSGEDFFSSRSVIKSYSLKIYVVNSRKFDKLAADIVARQLKQNPKSCFIFPSGSTPLGMYRLVVEAYKDKKTVLPKPRFLI